MLTLALAIMALAQPAPAQTAAKAEHAIRDQRAAFNRAIAAADLPAIAAVLADNVQMITGSDSIHVAGKQAHLDRWAEGFKDPNRLVYVRTPDHVTVSPLLPIALETGHRRGAASATPNDLDRRRLHRQMAPHRRRVARRGGDVWYDAL